MVLYDLTFRITCYSLVCIDYFCTNQAFHTSLSDVQDLDDLNKVHHVYHNYTSVEIQDLCTDALVLLIGSNNGYCYICISFPTMPTSTCQKNYLQVLQKIHLFGFRSCCSTVFFLAILKNFLIDIYYSQRYFLNVDSLLQHKL